MTRPAHHIACLAALLAATLLAACSGDEQLPQEAARVVALPVRLVMAPDGMGGDATRAPGDPGTYEHFVAPDYAYVFLVVELDGGGTQVCRLTDSDGLPLTLNADNSLTLTGEWHKELNGSDFPQTMHDSVYTYISTFYFEVPPTATVGRVYVAMSKVQLPSVAPATRGTGEIVYGTGGSTEDDVLNLGFDVEGSAMRSHLQDLYATPYNYCHSGTTTYYGTIADMSPTSAEHLNLMLYHVAAKVDVRWNVAEEQQSAFWLSFIEARHLAEYGCLLFRPTENVRSTVDTWSGDIRVPSDGYGFTLMGWNGTGSGSHESDRSRQWYGRQYFYTIPFRTQEYPAGDPAYSTPCYFDLQLRMLANDDTEASTTDGYNLLVRKDMSAADAVFVPWMRIDLRFTHELTYGTAERVIE